MPNKLFKIEAHELPSKAYSVTLREPQFKDRREASKRLPNDGTNLGYGIEQLMLAMSIEQINNIAPNTFALKDPIGKIRDLPTNDTQYLISLYLELFLLGKEGSDDAKAIANEMRQSPTNNFTIPKEAMPSQSFSVSFRQPSTGEQIEVDRLYPGPDSGCGYDLGELMFAYCITSIDGQVVTNKPKEVITLLDEWDYIDVQFAMAVFMNLSFIDNQAKNSARELGKKLRQRGDSSSTSSQRKAAKAQSTSSDLS